MDVSGPGAWLDLEEAQGERFVLLADHLTRLSDGALTRIDARDREWTAALDGGHAACSGLDGPLRGRLPQ